MKIGKKITEELWYIIIWIKYVSPNLSTSIIVSFFCYQKWLNKFQVVTVVGHLMKICLNINVLMLFLVGLIPV